METEDTTSHIHEVDASARSETVEEGHESDHWNNV